MQSATAVLGSTPARSIPRPSKLIVRRSGAAGVRSVVMLVTRERTACVSLVMTIGGAVVRQWGEPDAAVGVERLFRAEARSLVGMLTVYVGDRALAEDLTQEAFARLQRSWGQIRERDRVVAYLRAIAFNLARSAHRRRRLFAPVPDVASGVLADDAILLTEDQHAVISAVRRLPRQQRACIVLRYYGELGIDAIAETLGISPNSVKTHLRRGLDALERALEGQR